MRLKDKVAIVTGGASGVGQATAGLFAREGALVLVADINAAGAEATALSIRAEGGQAIAIGVDITNEASVAAMAARAVAAYGRIDVLFHAAAIVHFGKVADIPEAEWDKVIDTNLKGSFLCAKHVLPAMIKQGGGSIVFMASTMGLVAFPRYGVYNPSKGGVVLMTKNIALDYAEHNIRVNCICPSVIETPMGEQIVASIPGDYATNLAELKKAHPLGRLTRPLDVAYGAVYLASDESAYVTGSCLVIDGGITAA